LIRILRIPFAALLFVAGGAAPSLAQGTAPAAPSGEAAVTREAIGDWTKVCAASGSPCVIEQIGKTAQGEAALNMQIERLPKAQTVNGEQVEAVANVLTPLGVLLQNGLRLQIDGGEVQASPARARR
jgi:invasion protein IalB